MLVRETTLSPSLFFFVNDVNQFYFVLDVQYVGSVELICSCLSLFTISNGRQDSEVELILMGASFLLCCLESLASSK